MPLSKPPGRYLIYGLLDPREKELRYVGKTHKRRELRLAEHISAAENGEAAPVYSWIRSLLEVELEPVIFILARIPGTSDWRSAERREITRWRNWSADNLPYVHPPQSAKSKPVLINQVKLLNVQPGG